MPIRHYWPERSPYDVQGFRNFSTMGTTAEEQEVPGRESRESPEEQMLEQMEGSEQHS